MAAGVLAMLPMAAAGAGDAVLLSDHILLNGGLTSDDRPQGLIDLLTLADDTGDIYHPLGDPGLVSDRIDLTLVSFEMWDFDGRGDPAAEALFWDAWDPSLEANDDIVRIRPTTMPPFGAHNPWGVVTMTTAADSPIWEKIFPLERPFYVEMPVAWARPGFDTFDGAEGDLFDGINFATVLTFDPGVEFAIFDFEWVDGGFFPVDSMTFAAVYQNQTTLMFPMGADLFDAGPINFNFGSFASFGTQTFDPSQGGVDIVSAVIDVGVDVPRSSIYPFVAPPATSSTTTTTTTTAAPVPTSAEPAETSPPIDTAAVATDGGGINLWVLVLVALIIMGLFGGVLAGFWPWTWRWRWPPWEVRLADGDLDVNHVINGTDYTLCGTKGCHFVRSGIDAGICKSKGGACAAGCVCRTFRRPKKNWADSDYEWEHMPDGRKPHRPGGKKAKDEPAKDYVWHCLCVRG